MDGSESQEQSKCITFTYLFNFCDDNSIPAGGQKSKETAQIMFHKAFKMKEFNNVEVIGADNMLGSRSIRKLAATHACG